MGAGASKNGGEADIFCESFELSKTSLKCFLTRMIVKGNKDTSGLVSGLVTISSGDCGAKFKNVGNLKAILSSSLYSYPEANLYQFAKHPDGFQFTVPNPDVYSVSSKSVSVS